MIEGQRSMRRPPTKCLMQGRDTAIGDGRQEGGAEPCRSEETVSLQRKDGGETENSEGETVFIPGQSGEVADARRLARWGSAKPGWARAWLEAGKGAHFTRTYIINNINLNYIIYTKT